MGEARGGALLDRVDVLDLQPHMVVSAAASPQTGVEGAVGKRRGVNGPVLHENSVYGLMSTLLLQAPSSCGHTDIYSASLWERFAAVCLTSLFQTNSPFVPFVNALVDTKNYSLVARVSSLVRAVVQLQQTEHRFNLSSSLTPAANLQLTRSMQSVRSGSHELVLQSSRGVLNLRAMTDAVSEVQSRVFAVQSRIMKEMRGLLCLRDSQGTQEDEKEIVERVLHLAEELFQCTSLDMSSFGDDEDKSGREQALSDGIANMTTVELATQQVISGEVCAGGSLSDLQTWLRVNCEAGLLPVTSLVAFAEAFHSIQRLPALQLWLRSISANANGLSLNIMVEHFSSVLAACFTMHSRALNMRFVERVRWLIESAEARAVIALKGSSSCIEGIESLCVLLSAFDCGEETESKVGRVASAMITMLRSDLVDALSGSFAHAMDGNYFAEAFSTVLRLKELGSSVVVQRPAQESMDVVNDGPVGGQHAPLPRKQPWQVCLQSLISRVCEGGHLGWLCSIPNICIGSINISEVIMQELESLACSSELDSFLSSKKWQAGKVSGFSQERSERYVGSYYECLAAFQLSRFDFHGAARCLNSAASELEASRGNSLRLQAW